MPQRLHRIHHGGASCRINPKRDAGEDGDGEGEDGRPHFDDGSDTGEFGHGHGDAAAEGHAEDATDSG